MSNKVVIQELAKESSRAQIDAGPKVDTGDHLLIKMPVPDPQIQDVRKKIKKSSPAEPDRQVRLASGRFAAFSAVDKEDRLVVTSPEGRVELSIRFTESGPVLDFEAAAIQLKSAGEVAVQCNNFKVEAAKKIQLSTEGDMVQDIGGKAHVEAHSVEVRARRGNVDINANDDVRLLGERIKLNC